MGRPERRSLLNSLGYALSGLGQAWGTQRNLRIQVALAVVALVLAAVLGLGVAQWAMLITVISLVVTAELLNTALEAAVDAAQPEYHPKARMAKDVAAGAVVVASLGALAVGAWLFLPKVWSRLGFGP